MILLDMNIASELTKKRSDPAVLSSLNRYPFSSVWLSSVTVMELRFGVELLEDGRRKTELSEAIVRLVSAFGSRIAPFDAAAAEIAGRVSAARRRRGSIVDYRDTQIAGIAPAQKALLVTRNLRDFGDLELDRVNPWAS